MVLERPQARLSIGVCVRTALPPLVAHAHTRGPYRGWICILPGSSDMVLDHELAHIAAGHGGHTRAWAEIMESWGYRITLDGPQPGAEFTRLI